MAEKVRLYAWAAPAMDAAALPDHTWVTTYDSRKTAYKDIKAVVAAGEHFWYCWGVFRARGGTWRNQTGALGNAAGSGAVASCLAQPDGDCASTSAARGTIFQYGRHGVCHQLANQVLYATGSEEREPITVAAARGYMWTVFRFGAYGLPEQAWVTKRESCSDGRSRSSRRSGG
jgi:hypothetical protein